MELLAQPGVESISVKVSSLCGVIDLLAWEATLETGKATYWSRSRQKLWVKGETSGHQQMIREIRVDCDNDSVLFRVEQLGGAACHTGQTVTWDDLMKSRFQFCDYVDELSPDSAVPV